MDPPYPTRLRLQFSNGVLKKTQKKDGLKKSWVLIKPHFETISDVASYVFQSFRLFNSCPRGILLTMDGFVLPEFESISILNDKDIISVKRKETRLLGSNKAIEQANTYIEDEVVEKRPLASGVRLLANKEFDEETGGYQSETDEDAANVESPVRNPPSGELISKKRKASCKLQISKKKRKLEAKVNTIQKKHLHDGEHITKPQKKRKQDRITPPSSPEATEKSGDSEPESDSESELDQDKEGTKQESAVPGRPKKVSRSTLRKRTKRHIKKLQRAKAEQEKSDTQQPVKDLTTETEAKKDTTATIIQQNHEDSDSEEASDEEGDLVPVVVRPGLIRFTPFGKVKEVQETVEANTDDLNPTQNGAVEEHSVRKNVSDVKHNQIAKEAYCWNGITNKRKGQKWGQEMQANSTWKESRNGYTYSSNTGNDRKQQTASWKDSRDGNNGECSNAGTARNQSTSSLPETGDTNGQSDHIQADKNQQSNDKSVDFDKLIPLIDLPKVGDTIVYRLLELSSSWCPELSSFRVGKIASFEPNSNNIMLVPVPDYPLNLEKNDEDDDEQPHVSSAYNEDGSLEIDFSSLSDVRIMKLGESTQSQRIKFPVTNGSSTPSTSKDNEVPDTKKVASNIGVDANQELHVPTPDNGKKIASNVNVDTNQELHVPTPANGKDVWEEISDAVSAKKAQLMQEDKWNKKQTPTKRPSSYRNFRGSAIGPTMARLRAQNGP